MSIITRINKAEKRIVDLYNKLKNLPSGGGASGDFIPLSGTVVGSPVTGEIEVVEAGRTIFLNNGEAENSLVIAEGGTSIIAEDLINTYTAMISVEPSLNKVEVNCDNPASRGLTAVQDFTPNITDLDYTQKKYVDQANSYSTDEIKTGGTWIDGKPIYRRVITGTTNALGWWEMIQLQTSLSLKDFISMNVLQLYDGNYATTKTAVNNSGTLIVIPSSTAGETPWIGVKSYSGTPAFPISITFAVILEYTKITD